MLNVAVAPTVASYGGTGESFMPCKNSSQEPTVQGYGFLLSGLFPSKVETASHIPEARMKAMRTFNALILVLSIALLPAVAETITAADAKNHIGEQATVCGKVASEKTATGSRGEPTFINLDYAYPNQVFTVLVWGDDKKKVGELPCVASRLCASGVVQNYKGVPEIVVLSSGQLSH